jgi:Flp pilus assembly protein TadG
MSAPGFVAAVGRRLRASGPRDRGETVVELAILAPLMLLIIWMTIQYALYFEARQVALEAAQTGARFAEQNATKDVNWRVDAENAAKAFYNGLGTKVLGAGGIQATAVSPAAGEVRVTVSGDVASILLGVPIRIQEISSGPIECFRPDTAVGEAC